MCRDSVAIGTTFAWVVVSTVPSEHTGQCNQFVIRLAIAKGLHECSRHFEKLGNIHSDGKLYASAVVLEDWLDKGFNPVVFCRYIEIAKYLGEHLGAALRKKFPKPLQSRDRPLSLRLLGTTRREMN